MPIYSFTFKKQSHPRFFSILRDHLIGLGDKYPDAWWTYHYEEDKKGMLHVHGVCQSKTHIYVHDIHPGKGWTVDWSETIDLIAWRTYIAKHKNNEDFIVDKHNQLELDYIECHVKCLRERTYNDRVTEDDALPRKWKNKRIV